MSRAGLYLTKDAYFDTGYATYNATFSIRVKVKPKSSQAATNPCIATVKGYYAVAFTDFPWDLTWNNPTTGTFNAMHDRGNDFVGDNWITPGRGFPGDRWWDVVSVHRNSFQIMWVAPCEAPDKGVWADQVTAGNLSNSGRNVCVGRAPFEQAGGVGNSGFDGEVAHVEYWTFDITQRPGWLRDWKPPMKRGGGVPSGLARYYPLNDAGSPSSVLDLVSGATASISGSYTWVKSFTEPSLARKLNVGKR
jgi:hypothetical protein